MPMLAHERKRALREVGSSLTAIAVECGVSLPHVSLVNSEERDSPKVREAIARALGRPLEEVWAPWQDPRGVAAA